MTINIILTNAAKSWEQEKCSNRNLLLSLNLYFPPLLIDQRSKRISSSYPLLSSPQLFQFVSPIFPFLLCFLPLILSSHPPPLPLFLLSFPFLSYLAVLPFTAFKFFLYAHTLYHTLLLLNFLPSFLPSILPSFLLDLLLPFLSPSYSF